MRFGIAEAKAKVKPILEAMGQDVFDFGDNVDAANVVKLAGNFMIAAALEAMGEAVAMMRKSGVDASAGIEMLAQDDICVAGVPGLRSDDRARAVHAGGISAAARAQGYQPGDPDRGRGNAPMPTASLLHDRFVSAIAKGRSDMDWSAIALGAADDAGLKESR